MEHIMERLYEYLVIFGTSMVPVLELRAALVAAAAMGLHPLISYCVCVLGNSLPVPFLVLFVRPVFEWMRNKSDRLRGIVEKLEAKAEGKADQIRRYEKLGLCIFVAIPLPGTGAWTGSLIAAVLGMRVKDSFPMILLGVAIAGAIMTLASFGVFSGLSFLLG